ncbi:uncharacterized protein ARMOST_04601 [Armillaria ostoyae]|uniref:A-kinase anchor protein 7-like phosphoesterase domain-containing protein n=1 Tax=Armillaria ostoyae TaxID=47428 RepID=A0A284QXS8_ARMOS|nr:uncharacterized protein ARMOST_04601 [Armillaria ostoyae]
MDTRVFRARSGDVFCSHGEEREESPDDRTDSRLGAIFTIDQPRWRDGGGANLDSLFTVLSIPLVQTHPTLRARVSDFHAALNLATSDSTLLAGPQRVHFTLGVMNLTPESLPTALDLLHRPPTLLPLTATPPTITLDTLDVLKRESRRRAHVLWVGPSQPEPLFSQINQIFRDEGFITDTRPLKLHMTLMNSSYRRPEQNALSRLNTMLSSGRLVYRNVSACRRASTLSSRWL